MRHIRIAALACAALALAQNSFAAPLFSDDFNTLASAANYTVASSDITSSFPTFAYDYSADGIPSAPNSGGSTIGVKLDANKFPQGAGPGGALESVTLHTLVGFSGDYTVKFDAWINVNGAFPDGGSGSTNYLTGGVGGNGTTNNRGGISAPPTGVGGWFAVNGENGNGSDYRLHKDTVLQTAASGQYAAGSLNGTNAYYSQFGNILIDNFPVQGANNVPNPGAYAQQTGTSGGGTFGMAWHQIMLVVDADGGTAGAASVKWFADGLLLGTLDAGNGTSFAANGKVTLGYSDPSTNLSDAPALSFALIDNLQIVPEPATAALGALGLMLLAGFRRR